MEVSVLMSTYNDSAYLAESIDSVLSQDFTDFEFIIVNDGSPDLRTAQILGDYALRDARIRVVSKVNQGLTRALVDGCAAARGEYIARIDVGDVMTPDRLRRQAEALDRYPKVAFVSCWTEFCGPEWEHLWTEKGRQPTNDTNGHEEARVSVDRASVGSGTTVDGARRSVGGALRRGERISIRPSPSVSSVCSVGDSPSPASSSGLLALDSELRTPNAERRTPPPERLSVWIGSVLPDTPGDALKAGPTCHPSVMMRAAAYRRVGGYRWQFYYAQDWDLWTRLAENGDLAVVLATLYRCRIFPGGISMTQIQRQRLLAACIQGAAQARLQGQPEDPFLERASQIRPGADSTSQRTPWWRRAAGHYFVGSCLRRNGDPRCRRYFRESLRLNPWRAMAWLSLLVPLSGRPRRVPQGPQANRT